MSKRSAGRAVLRAKPVALAVAAAFVPWSLANAQTAPNTLPTNGAYVAGSGTGTIHAPTPDNYLRIDQSSTKGIINWQTFSIGSAAHVHFQHDAGRAGVTLNRVTGNSPSEIFGRLSANGQLFLVNNAGVFFAPGASVDVGSILASSLSITDQNFLNGTYQFTNPGSAGSVVNAGSIITANGYAALIGPQVRNDGVIVANAGKVALGAGDRVSLSFFGDNLVSLSVDEAAFNASIVNTGTLQADGGTVLLKASSANALLDTVINTSGVIRAASLVERNGEIILDGGGAGTVQVSNTLEAGDSIGIAAGGSLNVGSTVCCVGTVIFSASQDLRGASITVGGGAQVATNGGDGTQTITTPGTLLVRGGVVSGGVGIFHSGSGQQEIAAGNIVVQGGTGTGTSAFISSQSGDQAITVPGEIRVRGGSAGTANRAGIVVANANQTIGGNPDIFLDGGAGGGVGNASNNVFIQGSADPTKLQTINARSIAITAGAGADAAATINAARQVIATAGNVSLQSSAGTGPVNGVRIGGAGGSILGPTNLTLTVGGDLLLRGGGGNGATLGSSGASTQATNITLNAAGDIVLDRGAGGTVRLGASPSGSIVNPGSITATAGDDFTIGTGTGIRVSGPITLSADSLTNAGTITNGGGANTANVVLNADAFNLAAGNIQGGAAAVILRPRTGTNSFGIEAPGTTTLTNADIGSISTSNFVVFGSGTGTTFTGDMQIGESAQVNGGGKNLAFFRSANPGGSTTIGAQGVTTTADLIISAGGGAIASNGGTVIGDEVQLRASQSIGAPGLDARVLTDANVLAIQGGSAFVSEANDVTLRTITLSVGGIQNTIGTSTAGALNLAVGGALNVGSTVCCAPTTVMAETQDISAASITIGGGAQVVTSAGAGTQTITTPGTLLVRGGVLSGDVGLFHNGSGEQRVSAGNIELRGGTGTNTGAFINSTAGGNQHISVPGTIAITGGVGGTASRAGMIASANQTIDGNPDITLTGGAGGGAGNASNNVFIQAIGGDTKPQTINARSIRIASGAGMDASATLNAARQIIATTGDVSILGGAGPGGSNGARIGGLGGNTLGPTDLTLSVGGKLLVSGGAVNGATLGSSGASTQANNITVSAASDIRLESLGAAARIGSSSQAGATPGNISVTAGGSLELSNGTAVRTNGPITLTADSLTNRGTITNGGGANTPNVILNANAFNLAAGSIQGGAGAVILRPRTGTNSFGIEAAGTTTLTNADIGSINTSNFVVFGSGLGSFTGSMTIGQDALVDAGQKNLAFFRTGPGATTIGAHGIATTGDVIIASTSGGSIVSNGGIVAGDEVQLRATLGIGLPGAAVRTDANALTIVNSSGGGPLVTGNAFVIEADDVTLRSTSLIVGGNLNAVSNFVSGSLEFEAGGNVNVVGTVQTLGTMNADIGGGLTLDASAQDAVLTSNGGQVISAGSVSLTAQNGRRALIENIGGHQDVSATAGDMNLQVPGAFGTAQIVNNAPGGNQIIDVSGQLNVLGGAITSTQRNSGLFKIGAGGLQDVKAAGITLQGGSSGIGAAALISSQSDQKVDASGGDIHILGGNGGVTNNAAILASAVGQQTVLARHINLANGFGGTDTVAAIQAGRQLIDVTGDVTLTSQGAILGTAPGGPGVRIGAPQNTPAGTDVTLLVDGNLVINGGSAADNGAAIGSSGASAPAPNTITIDAGGSVILNAGTPSNTGVRIGSGGNGLAGGNISIKAAGSIELNGTQRSASIRTLGSVNLHADQPGGTISESGNGSILAGSLTTSSSGSSTLTGPNQVANFSATSGGDLSFDNSGALTITALNAFDTTISNTGNVTVSGIVTSNGAMDLDVAGDIAVVAAGTQDAMLRSFGGQNINARSLAVTSTDGRTAAVWNTGPSVQSINLSGGAGLDVQTLSPGGFAQVLADGGSSQAIAVTSGDHISVNGIGGVAMIGAFGGGQTLSITGSGANAITLGGAGSLGPSSVFGGVQTITAGAAGESGSITITGGNGNATFTGISSGQIVGGTQTVSTSGALRINGGDAPFQPPSGFATGLFHNGSGEQRVSAGSLEMRGGSSGANNLAIVISSGGAGTIPAGSQVLEVAGAMDLAGGAAGNNNSAIIVSFADQTTRAGSVRLTGGTSGGNNGAFINIAGAGPAGTQLLEVAGDLDIAGGAGGNAGITGSASRQQTIFADNIRLTNAAAGGNNSVGFVLGGHQDIHAAGDVTLTARASGGDLPGVRIGGLAGAAPTASDLTLTLGGDLVLTGGTAANNGVGIGSTAASGVAPLANNITIEAGGSVILNSGVATSGVRIGSPQTATGPGAIRITAGGDIDLNGLGESAAIRSLGAVTLSANRITEDARGRIIAGDLGTSSVGDTLLVGLNQVASFTAASETGNVHLRNSAPLLTLGSMDLPGSLTVEQTGTLSIPGTVAALSHEFQATGDVLVGSAGATNAALLYAVGDIAISTPGSVIVRGSDVTPLAASAVLADGELNVSAGNVVLTGGAALGTPAVARGEHVTMNIGSELTVTGGSGHFSPALLSSGSNIDLAVGSAVRIDAGSGYLSLARIQTEIRDGVIHIAFPNLSEGGYFVNGIEGDTHHGQTGFFTLNKPAKEGRSLLLDYGS